ncbi:hypothetical protein KKF84_02570 [Myxococcota bacterium]|nr:hypothetical protein [Myxococcota bacterium]
MKKILILLALTLLFGGCDDTTQSTQNNSNNANNINNINNNNPCGDVGGAPYNYAISEIYMPVASTEGIGVDLDGDDFIDNKLANLIQSLLSISPDFDMNGPLADSLAKGTTAILMRMWVDTFTTPGDGNVSCTIYEGSYTGSTPETMFDGSDHFAIDPSGTNTPTLCGRLYGAGVTELGPGTVTVNIPISETDSISLDLVHAQIKGISSATSLSDFVIAGAVDPAKLRDEILPAFVDDINNAITDDPEGSQDILNSFDNNCSAEIPGCESLTDCVADGIISLKELQCNETVNIILTPDVTLDGHDYVSLGVRIQGVSAIIDNID